ncbi:MAG: amino acid permease, partial [Candidatus Marinimicrobia bacterium]|nr:amino acid permease [Candidatus Neomarinimicrobiota bacterium]
MNSASPELKRSLGIFDGIGLLVGITIGAGIYSTPQIIAGYLSSYGTIMLLWIGVALFVYVGSLIYAELGSRFPETGGEYVYILKAFGPFWGFLFGWAQLFIIRTSPAAGLSLVTANYIGFFIDLNRTEKIIIALSVLALFGALNVAGVNKASFYNKLSSAAKIGGLAILGVVGMLLLNGNGDFLSQTAHPTATLGPVGNVIAALMLVLFSYIGWDRVGYVAGEMKNPRKVIPLSMFLGMGIIIALYLLMNTLYHATLGMEGMRGSTIVASDAAVQIFGSVGAAVVSLLVIVSATGSINGTIMSASRVYYAMARDGLLFKWLDYIHPIFQTPTRAIFAHCVWGAVILVVRGTFETIVAGMVFAILIFYTFTTIALFKFRRERAGSKDAYEIPGFPVVPG